MMIGWPSFSETCLLTRRSVTSLAPPGAYGTMSFNGCFGQSDWANALGHSESAAVPAAACARKWRRRVEWVMFVSRWGFASVAALDDVEQIVDRLFDAPPDGG